MSDSDRPVTPFTPFDSRPRLEVAKSVPVDPFESLPRIPRAPRTPSGISGVDTEPAPPLTSEEAEQTPAESPFSMRVMRRFDKLERAIEKVDGHSSIAANAALEAVAAVRLLTVELDQLKRRMTAYEVANQWVPRLAWVATTAIAVLALWRTYR